MNNKITRPQTETLTARLQDHIALAAAAALNRGRHPESQPRLTLFPEEAFAWTPINIPVRPRSRASRWIE